MGFPRNSLYPPVKDINFQKQYPLPLEFHQSFLHFLGIFHCFFSFFTWNSIKTFNTPCNFSLFFLSSFPWNSIKTFNPSTLWNFSVFFTSNPCNFQKIQTLLKFRCPQQDGHEFFWKMSIQYLSLKLIP